MDILGRRMMNLGARRASRPSRRATASRRIKPKLAGRRRSAFLRHVLFTLKKAIAFWLMPLPFCLALMLAGAVLAYGARRRRAGRAVFAAGLALLLLLSNQRVSRWLIRPLEARYPAMPELVATRPAPADLAACEFVLVLGGGNGSGPGMSANNLLSAGSLARIVEGVRLLRHLPHARLVVSGPAGPNGETHATVLARTAQMLGIPPERILYIDRARDTEEEAIAARRLLGDARVALVTSAWHMPRAIALARHAGLHVLPCPADYTAHADEGLRFADLLCDVSSLERSTLAVRERLGYLWVWLRGKT